MTVMPCYDKKLEAVRDDFTFEVASQDRSIESPIRIPEVDSVLTSGEVLDLIKVIFLVTSLIFLVKKVRSVCPT